MDYTSTKLAGDLQVPHSMAVKKLRKYAGANKGKAGTIYKKINKKRLTIVPLGRNEGQTVYQFSKSDYDVCVGDEARYYEKLREQSRARGQAAWGDKTKGLRKAHENRKKGK